MPRILLASMAATMGRGKRRATIVIAATPSAEAATRGTRPRERRTATAAASSGVRRERTVRPGKSPRGPETRSWATSHVTVPIGLRPSSGRSRNLRCHAADGSDQQSGTARAADPQDRLSGRRHPVRSHHVPYDDHRSAWGQFPSGIGTDFNRAGSITTCLMR